ncbi:hypothetical protein Tco_1291578 [Tanacetum coccineum]
MGSNKENGPEMKKKYQISFDEQEAIRLQAEFDEEVRLAREKDETNVMEKHKRFASAKSFCKYFKNCLSKAVQEDRDHLLFELRTELVKGNVKWKKVLRKAR